jgi:2-desacetyl-2-hydroxyethyl bacteriochlorophyllide A dehydrogenase
VKVAVVQPSITEVQLFGGVRSSGYDVVVERLNRGPAALFGHEFAGEVTAVHEDEDHGIKVGDRVTALHSRLGTIGRHFAGCFAEVAAVPVDALVKVPSALSDWEAAALQPLSSCVRNVMDLGISLGDTVLVLGQGVMGLNSAQAAKAAGADVVIGVDRRRDLLDIAEQLGVDHTIDASDRDVLEAVRDLTGGRGAPFVIEAASGSPSVGLSGGETVTDAVACVSAGGTVMSLAHYHAPVLMDFNVCRRKRLTYMFPKRAASNEDMAVSARLVAEGRIQLEPMITHKLSGIEQVLEAITITGNKAAYGALNPAQVRVG